MKDTETDPVRKKILAAMDRLLAGNPLRSTGRLNVSQLAVEAGVERWHLTHQHVDLKEMFQAHVRNEGTTPAPFRGTAAAFDDLHEAHRALQAHCAELEQRIKMYANVIQMLAMERATSTQGRPVTDIASRRMPPR
ncbi:hypothetical protein [Mycolicibacterium aubagnense]|uniref:Uncharacterized protein n=1 Tax=Mycolicibacterium aubagnense TaxID=319707 RepID=A0ABM7IMV3_9MYCO|nr:hypothetical protein [Mycolicibacterium aubagnense]TLH64407.1 hypothetical protein C1S80_12000 [Mycolicibacterium aubagnense]WGI35915.1 hypothetical protein QDT91_28275 [Mycolicibacterium aubagnense]BBX88028.1 hypothetical protein MAUB_59010 [Mycolicibacterium aubagnense]